MKIISIVGARSNFIKLAPLSRELRKKHTEVIIHTGQHYDYKMSQLFFDGLRISAPDYNLDSGSGTHAEQTSKMLIGIERILTKEKPDMVLVYGDTNSTLSGALAASKLDVRIGHIEAGVRSFNRHMPEEINRIVTDHVCDLLFCPTENAVGLLKKEGITKRVHFTGDIMYDSVIENIKAVEKKSKILEDLGIKPGEYLLCTVHRAENTDSRKILTSIFKAFSDLDEKLIIPLHPRTLKAAKSFGLYKKIKMCGNIILTEPVSYLDMLNLEKNARKIVTDSGGVQKEAYFLGIPCITLRCETEWVETTRDGWNILTGSDKNMIAKAVKKIQPTAKRCNYFGDGKAAERIVDIIETEEKSQRHSKTEQRIY